MVKLVPVGTYSCKNAFPYQDSDDKFIEIMLTSLVQSYQQKRVKTLFENRDGVRPHECERIIGNTGYTGSRCANGILTGDRGNGQGDYRP
jgi:hypothetical protein